MQIIRNNRQMIFGVIIGAMIVVPWLLFINAKSNDKQAMVTPTQQSSTNTKVEDNLTAPKAKTSTQNNTNNSNSTTKTGTTPLAPLPAPISLAAVCNQGLANLYLSQKNADIATEDALHASFVPSGPPDSSYYANSIDNENKRHTAVLAQIDAKYQINMTSAHCI